MLCEECGRACFLWSVQPHWCLNSPETLWLAIISPSLSISLCHHFWGRFRLKHFQHTQARLSSQFVLPSENLHPVFLLTLCVIAPCLKFTLHSDHSDTALPSCVLQVEFVPVIPPLYFMELNSVFATWVYRAKLAALLLSVLFDLISHFHKWTMDNVRRIRSKQNSRQYHALTLILGTGRCAK